jgi:hypothetical protein
MEFFSMVILIFLILVSVYTASYGVWTWKRKNKLGAVMIFLVALSVIGLPVYSMFFIG